MSRWGFSALASWYASRKPIPLLGSAGLGRSRARSAIMSMASRSPEGSGRLSPPIAPMLAPAPKRRLYSLVTIPSTSRPAISALSPSFSSSTNPPSDSQMFPQLTTALRAPCEMRPIPEFSADFSQMSRRWCEGVRGRVLANLHAAKKHRHPLVTW